MIITNYTHNNQKYVDIKEVTVEIPNEKFNMYSVNNSYGLTLNKSHAQRIINITMKRFHDYDIKLDVLSKQENGGQGDTITYIRSDHEGTENYSFEVVAVMQRTPAPSTPDGAESEVFVTYKIKCINKGSTVKQN
jgi:hypothetical protein